MVQEPWLVVSSELEPASDWQQLYEFRRRVEQIQVDLNPLIEALSEHSTVSVEPSWLEERAPIICIVGIFMGLIGCGIAVGAERIASSQLAQQEIAVVRMLDVRASTEILAANLDSVSNMGVESPEVSDASSALVDVNAAPDQLGIIPLVDSTIELTVPGGDSDLVEISEADTAAVRESGGNDSELTIRTVMVNGRSFDIPVPPLSTQANKSAVALLPSDAQHTIDLHMLKMPRQLTVIDPTGTNTLYGKNPKEILRQIHSLKMR